MMLRRLILHELKGGEELYLFKILTLTNEGGWARVPDIDYFYINPRILRWPSEMGSDGKTHPPLHLKTN